MSLWLWSMARAVFIIDYFAFFVSSFCADCNYLTFNNLYYSSYYPLMALTQLKNDQLANQRKQFLIGGGYFLSYLGKLKLCLPGEFVHSTPSWKGFVPQSRGLSMIELRPYLLCHSIHHWHPLIFLPHREPMRKVHHILIGGGFYFHLSVCLHFFRRLLTGFLIQRILEELQTKGSGLQKLNHLRCPFEPLKPIAREKSCYEFRQLEKVTHLVALQVFLALVQQHRSFLLGCQVMK